MQCCYQDTAFPLSSKSISQALILFVDVVKVFITGDPSCTVQGVSLIPSPQMMQVGLICPVDRSTQCCVPNVDSTREGL